MTGLTPVSRGPGKVPGVRHVQCVNSFLSSVLQSAKGSELKRTKNISAIFLENFILETVMTRCYDTEEEPVSGRVSSLDPHCTCLSSETKSQTAAGIWGFPVSSGLVGTCGSRRRQSKHQQKQHDRNSEPARDAPRDHGQRDRDSRGQTRQRLMACYSERSEAHLCHHLTSPAHLITSSMRSSGHNNV